MPPCQLPRLAMEESSRMSQRPRMKHRVHVRDNMLHVRERNRVVHNEVRCGPRDPVGDRSMANGDDAGFQSRTSVRPARSIGSSRQSPPRTFRPSTPCSLNPLDPLNWYFGRKYSLYFFGTKGPGGFGSKTSVAGGTRKVLWKSPKPPSPAGQEKCFENRGLASRFPGHGL